MAGSHVDERSQTSAGFSVLGIDTMAPLVGAACCSTWPGEARLPPEHSITAEELQRPQRPAASRSGRATWCSCAPATARCGIEPKEYLHAAGVSAAGSRWLAGPEGEGGRRRQHGLRRHGRLRRRSSASRCPGHILLLVRAGIPIIENLNLEELAAAGVHEFAFVCLPLKMRGVTGSPVRPIALA